MQHADLSRGSLAESAGLSRMSLAESTHLDLRKNGPQTHANSARSKIVQDQSSTVICFVRGLSAC